MHVGRKKACIFNSNGPDAYVFKIEGRGFTQLEFLYVAIPSGNCMFMALVHYSDVKACLFSSLLRHKEAEGEIRRKNS